MSELSNSVRENAHEGPVGATWDAIRRGIEQIQALPRPEPKHLKCAQSTFDSAAARLPTAKPSDAAAFTGIPIFIDDDLPHGRWEVGAGRRPTDDTEYEHANPTPSTDQETP